MKEAFEIRNRLNDARGICSSSIIMGEIYIEKGAYSRASNFLHTGLKISLESGFENKEKGAYEKLAKLHTKIGNADSVNYYYSMFYAIEKAQYESNLNDQVNELQTIYETEKKDLENEKLAREKAEEVAKRKTADLKVSARNNIIIIVASLAFLLLFAGLLILQRSKKIAAQEKNEALEIERYKGLKAVFKAQEDERGRISNDLHDGIGQQLSGLKLAWSSITSEIENPATKEKLGQLTEILDKSTDEVRDISHQMMPKTLSEFGTSKALESMLSDSFKYTAIQYEFHDLNVGDKRFSSDIELTIFRVSQEAINNCIKHSGASLISYQFYTQQQNIHILIEDNGKGLTHAESEDGHGLLNMKNRVRSVNGNINFESSNKGLVVSLLIPIQ